MRSNEMKENETLTQSRYKLKLSTLQSIPWYLLVKYCQYNSGLIVWRGREPESAENFGINTNPLGENKNVNRQGNQTH